MITEKQEKILDLLRFSLGQEGISEDEYIIGYEGDEKKLVEGYCLLASENGEWSALFVSNGEVSIRSIHENFRDAVDVFYWKVTRRETPWKYRQEWEDKTGWSL